LHDEVPEETLENLTVDTMLVDEDYRNAYALGLNNFEGGSDRFSPHIRKHHADLLDIGRNNKGTLLNTRGSRVEALAVVIGASAKLGHSAPRKQCDTAE
jgi:hypothetical protein